MADNGNGPPERAATTITTPPPSAEVSAHRVRERCPLIRAARRLDEPMVWLAIARFHPAHLCPARRERAA